MKEVDALTNNITHRPWNVPVGPWSYYQEWNNGLFLHWKIPTDELTKLIPKGIAVDTCNGESWISLVAFTMEHIRPRNLPSVSIVSRFHEINIRTYVKQGNKSGVYFLSIEAEKAISCFVARFLSGLPYTKAKIHFQTRGNSHAYSCFNKNKGFHFEANFVVGNPIDQKSPLDLWLTERYCLYLERGQKNFRYEIHHEPWDLNRVETLNLKVHYKIGNIVLNKEPDVVHYSGGVKVVAWKRNGL